jgi:hypothetical protein
MRVLIFVAGVATAVLFDMPASHAWYGNGPWCAVESIGFSTVTEDCSVRSFEECRMLTIAGNRGFCTPNPRWTGPSVYAEPRKRTKKRRAHSQ